MFSTHAPFALSLSKGKRGVFQHPVRRCEKGFTLIEMLIVLVVISIIIGAILPQFRGAQDEAAVQRAKADLRTVATAIESYYIHNSNALPTALSNLTTATPRIISSVPADPFRASGTAYSYLKDTNSVYYVVFAYGPDRAADITSISTAGVVSAKDDDICVTNGSGC